MTRTSDAVAVTARDKHGTFTKARRADGPPLDRRTTRWFAVVRGSWSRGYPTRASAEGAEREMLGRVEAGVDLAAGSATVADFLRKVWLKNARAKAGRGEIKTGTLAHYEIIAEKYVIPTLGDKRLRDLQPAHLRDFYAELGERLKPKTVRNVHVVLSNALSLAQSDGYVVRNVAKLDQVAPGGAKSIERPTWTGEQAHAFLAASTGDRLFALWRLIALTGLRRGEAIGLRWSDVDLDGARLNVTRSLVRGPDGVTRMETPKSDKSGRAVDLDAVTVEALRAHRTAQKREQLASMGAWPTEGDDCDLIFTDEAGRALSPPTASRRFRKAVADAGVPVIGLHDLRHTHATILLARGEPVHVVQKRLGHADPSTTLRIYAHVMPSQAASAAASAAEAIDG